MHTSPIRMPRLKSQFNSNFSFLPTHIPTGNRWGLKDVGHCHSCLRPAVSSWVLALGWSSPSSWDFWEWLPIYHYIFQIKSSTYVMSWLHFQFDLLLMSIWASADDSSGVWSLTSTWETPKWVPSSKAFGKSISRWKISLLQVNKK